MAYAVETHEGRITFLGDCKFKQGVKLIAIDTVDKLFKIDGFKLKAKPNIGDLAVLEARGGFLNSVTIKEVYVPDVWEEPKQEAEPWEE